MSPGKDPAVLMPNSEVVNKLVISTLIPCDRPTHDFQNRWCYSRHVIERFTFVQLLYPLLTDISADWRTFCLLTLAVQYQPLEREAPQGGLDTLPVKRIREANLNTVLEYPGQSVRSTSAEYYRDCIQSLISSKVMMNQFQWTLFLIIRKIFYIWKRPDSSQDTQPAANIVYTSCGFQSNLQAHHSLAKYVTVDRKVSTNSLTAHTPSVICDFNKPR